MTATTLHLGYFGSGVLFAGLFLLPGIGYRYLKLNGIAMFWTAYVLTRPFGASFADWTGVSHVRGGLDWGSGNVALLLTTLIAVIVVKLARQARRP